MRRLGGRFSVELGIDVDLGPEEVERWALASTLLGTGAPTGTLLRSWDVLRGAGIDTIAAAGEREHEEQVDLLGERMASRLRILASALDRRYGGRVTPFGEALVDAPELERTLLGLPGWGPVTVHTFLRELRGIWPGASPAVDVRAATAAEHAHLPVSLEDLGALAVAAHLDLRDLEAALCRLAASHELAICPGGEECFVVAADPQDYGQP